MPFVQSAPGGRLTDWRSQCQQTYDAKKDHGLTTDGEYRVHLQRQPVEARDMQRSHTVIQPYFTIKGCVSTTNPSLAKYRMS